MACPLGRRREKRTRASAADFAPGLTGRLFRSKNASERTAPRFRMWASAASYRASYISSPEKTASAGRSGDTAAPQSGQRTWPKLVNRLRRISWMPETVDTVDMEFDTTFFAAMKIGRGIWETSSAFTKSEIRSASRTVFVWILV